MKPVVFTEENYDFQKAVRQFITFSVQKRQLKAFAYLLPVWSFWDTVMEYGIEITGSSGTGLLGG